MSNQPLTYSAILTLSSPDGADGVVVNVTLHAGDTISADGVHKPLGQCTLRELRAYANKLELDVAETWQQITLSELADRPDIDLQVVTEADNWQDSIVVVDVSDSEAIRAEQDEQTIVAETDDDLTAEAMPAAEIDTATPIETETADDSLEQAIQFEEVAIEEVAIEELPPRIEFLNDAPEVTDDGDDDEPATVAAEPERKHDQRTAGEISDTRRVDRNAVHIYLDEKPLRMMQSHARSSLRREVAGVMIGPRPEKRPDGRYQVHVTDMIVAKHTRMSGASVTYTPESWRYMNDRLAQMYPHGDHVIVGWYHTHPGFGIFLSNMDLFIHTNFFTQKWHIAYVLDPVGYRSGFFSWDRPRQNVISYGFPWPEWMVGSW